LSEGVGTDILSLKCFEIYCLVEPARIWAVQSLPSYCPFIVFSLRFKFVLFTK
jgi:hypothetical protein